MTRINQCPSTLHVAPAEEDIMSSLSMSRIKIKLSTVKPRFNEPLYNEVLGITNDIFQPSQSYSKMYGTVPRYNGEILVITNTIWKPKRKMYLDITNYS